VIGAILGTVERLRRLVLAAFAPAVFAGACTLFTDLDTFNQPPSIVIGQDGGPDAPSTSNDDGGNAIGDAASDRGTTADAPTDGCGSPTWFCDDFDRATAVEAPWGGSIVTGGTLSITLDASVSPPGSLLVARDPAAVGSQVYLNTTLPAATKAVHVEFDLDLGPVTANTEIDAVQLTWLSPPPPCTTLGYFFVQDKTGPWVLQETYGGCDAGKNDNLPAPDGGFHHWALDITVGDVGVLQVRRDGVLVLNKGVLAPAGSGMKLQLGSGGAVTSGWTTHYDNVEFRVE
jgi:hypothetical protein